MMMVIARMVMMMVRNGDGDSDDGNDDGDSEDGDDDGEGDGAGNDIRYCIHLMQLYHF